MVDVIEGIAVPADSGLIVNAHAKSSPVPTFHLSFSGVK